MASTRFLSTMDDWMRDQERRVTSVERRKRRLSGTSGQTTISVSDTDTVNLTLTGDPTAGYGLSADVTAVPVARLTGPGTIAPALLPAPTPTPLTVTDSTTIDLTLTGAGTSGSPWNVRGDVLAVPVSLLTGPGTIAPALLPAATPTPVTVTDTTTIDLTLTGAGTSGSPWNVKGDVLAVPVGLLTGPGTIPPALLPTTPVPTVAGAWAYLPSNVTVAQNVPFLIGASTSPSTAWSKELAGGVTLNDTTGTFTVPTAGLYEITLGIYYDNNVSGANRLGFVNNTAGARVIDLYAYGSNPVTKLVTGTRTVRLAAAETLRAFTFHDAGGPLNILGNATPGLATFFQFRLVAP